MVLTLFGVTLFAVEEYIILELLHVSFNLPILSQRITSVLKFIIFDGFIHAQAKDAGGSMIIHAFGAYYGLTISWILYRPLLSQSKNYQGSVYHSDVFAMIGE